MEKIIESLNEYNKDKQDKDKIKLEDLVSLLNDSNNNNNNRKKQNRRDLVDEFGLLIAAASAVVIGHAINVFLIHLIEDKIIHYGLLMHFIYVLVIIIVFIVIAYYFDSLVDDTIR